ncbi:MAG: hypothetical protein AB4080_17405 [Trichodesmium sp.]
METLDNNFLVIESSASYEKKATEEEFNSEESRENKDSVASQKNEDANK